MSEVTATMIEERNRKYLESLQGNIGKYLSFLSTMARFHKYAVADLTSFAIEAPAMFTAVASAEFWEKHFSDMPGKRAERLVDALIGRFTSVVFVVLKRKAP